jgi:MFS-type transporter involved in bile tolerance (Atg22 family)
MEFNPNQINCLYWLMYDWDKLNYEVVSISTYGSIIFADDGKIHSWILLEMKFNDITKKVIVNEAGVPFFMP